jgi:uncharacterized protein (TIGR04255 family)
VVYPTLKNAPILLSVLEIIFECDKDIKYFDANHLYKSYTHKYPQFSTKSTANFEIKENIIRLGRPVMSGVDYINKQEGYELSLSPTSFDLKSTGEYQNWEVFKKRAMDDWDILVSKIKPIKIKRISLRYINSINLEIKNYALEELTKTYIQSGEDLDKSISKYFFKIQYNPQNDKDTSVQYSQELKGEENQVKLIIDIDVLKYKEYESSNFEVIWDDFNRLRDIKNDYFFKNLGPILQEKFK